MSKDNRRHVCRARPAAGTSRSPALSVQALTLTHKDKPSPARKKSSVGPVAARSASTAATAPYATPTPWRRATTRTRPATSGRRVMQHLYYDLGQQKKGATAVVTLDKQANVQLMTSSAYQCTSPAGRTAITAD
jgi:Domain of unknown function (DUF1883)